MRAAVGFSIHTGWAAAVVLSERGELLARARLELADDGSRFVYHLVAEQGQPRRRIGEVAAAARQHAEQAVGKLVDQFGVTVAAVPPAKRALPPVDKILASHSLIHSAEGVLYRDAIVDGCRAAGLEVVTPAPKSPNVGKPGAPWGKDQKDAAALAWAALQR